MPAWMHAGRGALVLATACAGRAGGGGRGRRLALVLLAAREACPCAASIHSVGQSLNQPCTHQVEGVIPPELSGTLLRNGPALFEVGGRRITQPFDGDGMVSRQRRAEEEGAHKKKLRRWLYSWCCSLQQQR